MELTEAQLYNLQGDGGRSAANDALRASNTYALQLMIEHLYAVHGMGPRAIAQELRIPQGMVSKVIARLKVDRDAYESRKKHNPRIA